MYELNKPGYVESDRMAQKDFRRFDVFKLKEVLSQYEEGLITAIELAGWLADFGSVATEILQRHEQIVK